MFSDLIQMAVALLCGLILVAAALMVLHTSHSLEISPRAAAALMVGAAGAWIIVRALHGEHVLQGDPESLLLIGAACWVMAARRRRRDHPLRRASDLLEVDDIVARTPPPERHPWAGGDGQRRPPC